MTQPTLAIDFGTSTSSAVLVLPDGLPAAAALRTRLHLADFVRSVKHQLSGVDQVEDHPTPTSAPYHLSIRTWTPAR